jgi:hypothetical protein
MKLKQNKYGIFEWTIVILAFLLIVFSFFALHLLTRKSDINIDFTETGQIGDTIGGIMNPFISLAGVLLTFFAFYIQVKANKQQYYNFKLELKEQREQFVKSQFENQFYEMLRLHKENVNEFSIEQVLFNDSGEKSKQLISGRKVFELWKTELEILILLAKKHLHDIDTRNQLNKTYGVFFHGLDNQADTNLGFITIALKIKNLYRLHTYSNLKRVCYGEFENEIIYSNELGYDLFSGHSHLLAHYYRHLFQIVKFVVSQDEKILKYEDKRKYLRILRAQLSNNEQAMLFYN